MIRRRHLLQASAGLLAVPAIVEKVGAQTAFDWKQFKGTKLEVNLAKSPRSDVLQAHQKEFEELTGIKVGSEQIPEQQQRPKVAIELSSGRPSFDVVNVALHVQKRLIEKGKWLADIRPMLKDPKLTVADFDYGDFSPAVVKAATAPDGLVHTLPLNQDLFILFYNKALLAEKGLSVPKTYAEMLDAAVKVTDKTKGVYGFVGRGLKNANMALFDTILLGWDQETISADGKTLLMDTPEAIAAGQYFAKLMRETSPPGAVGFNWNESQTTFSQARAAMWLDGVGFSAPLVDKTKSKVVDTVGFAVVPAGPKGHFTATYIDGIGIAEGSRNKGAAWLYCQWATSKAMCLEMLRTGSGTPGRASSYADEGVQKGSPFPKEWFDTVKASLKIARSGLPEIVAVTEFRDVFGIAITNTLGGADVATELKKATETFKPVLAKELT
ncbi:ABC transporter substrate-binding protein [Limobrevibacterium gyesilva]|uniref:Sugar ABC transporter substrate-binding protein n=1 Tax=Limobrevibacterium gyesilva TaxID=2991712 RepID=A0AA41YRE1_9PROT|nr:sugar ABC transporter substrate-binding protein [Limobrevibacterium gyesilva]MCW3475120.1 sugar ABC transporter substrate-binding protein [Limobrevibacterium gyesilva]